MWMTEATERRVCVSRIRKKWKQKHIRTIIHIGAPEYSTGILKNICHICLPHIIYVYNILIYMKRVWVFAYMYIVKSATSTQKPGLVDWNALTHTLHVFIQTQTSISLTVVISRMWPMNGYVCSVCWIYTYVYIVAYTRYTYIHLIIEYIIIQIHMRRT